MYSSSVEKQQRSSGSFVNQVLDHVLFRESLSSPQSVVSNRSRFPRQEDQMTVAETRSSSAIIRGVCPTARLPREMLAVSMALLFTV